MLKDTLMKRLADPSKHRGDFLNQAIDDMKTENFFQRRENPNVVEKLTAEHEAMMKKRENPNSDLTWEEYQSMTFTQMVVNETLGISNVPLGLFRKALSDFQVKGYTVPAGWTLMLVTHVVQLNLDTFKDPVTFNPWALDSHCPVGSGSGHWPLDLRLWFHIYANAIIQEE
ncbi:unnamed protein product [Dovyalis caffra]|uniref:Uncharacterized protein n=1 Tax=Dovyalis caffra TaxID=77055 RepID=A0AAV1RX40_9ROSI|nr:unnamed protein product [Dovyalis caffra]